MKKLFTAIIAITWIGVILSFVRLHLILTEPFYPLRKSEDSAGVSNSQEAVPSAPPPGFVIVQNNVGYCPKGPDGWIYTFHDPYTKQQAIDLAWEHFRMEEKQRLAGEWKEVK